MSNFDFKKANSLIPVILLIGVGIGSANWVMHNGMNWIKWVLQALVTSFIIGYSLVAIATNKERIATIVPNTWKRYSLLGFVFFLIGVFSSEVEHLFRSLVFFDEGYRPFQAGRVYFFNGILSLIFGFSFFEGSLLSKPDENKKTNLATENEPNEKTTSENTSPQKPPLTQIPIKQGQNILLLNTSDILYFEANDNYAFVYDHQLKKRLCDYNLLFLETRLAPHFVRIHRKYIINVKYIQQIKPHFNSRYDIELKAAQPVSLRSSKGYIEAIRNLIKLS